MATSNLIDIARGQLPKLTGDRKYGRRSDVGATEQDVWTPGEAASGAQGLRTPPVTAGLVSIVSSSALDAAGGSGATKVTVEVLDADWRPASYTIVPDGVTPAAGEASQTAVRIQRAYVSECGAGGVNAGRIDVSIAGAAGVQAQIQAGRGESLEAMLSVPRGRRAFVLRAVVESPTSDVVVRLYWRDGSSSISSWRAVREWRTGAHLDQELSRVIAGPFAERSDFIMRAAVAAGSAWVTAGFELLLEAT